nr:immunoglobulin heavy chain junction region [Mus musculus]
CARHFQLGREGFDYW